MKRTWLFYIFFLPTALWAQVTVTIYDKSNGQGVEGVLVVATSLKGQPIAQSVSDAQGLIQLRVSEFPFLLTTSHLSYIAVERKVLSAGELKLEVESNYTELEDVIITGQYEPQSARNSVYKVRTIGMERIQSVGATRIQDVLNTELNVRFSQDLAAGGSNLTLQGLSGQNVKVLIDGVPMVGRQGTGNEININQINVHTIERIEIVEGPMAVNYGADALAGVINIITKKPTEKWTATVSLQEETVGGEYGVNEGIHNESVSLGYAGNNFYTLVDGGRNFFGGWKGSAEDRDKEWHPKTQWFGNAMAGYKKNKTDIYYRIDYLNENIYNPGLFNGVEAIDQRYITDRFMHQVQATSPIGERLSYTGAVSYTDYTRKIQSVTVNKATGDERLALGPGLQDETKFGGVTVRGTFQYKLSNTLSIQPGYDVNYEWGSGGRLKSGTSTMGDYALFVSAELKPTTWLNIRPGVRFLKNSVYDAPPLIPSLNTKFQINEHHDLRVSYGRGFRAPSIRELYFNFFDASHAVEGNPELEAELSHSINVSWNWSLVAKADYTVNTSLSGFYNSVDNMIGYGVKPGNASITTYLNIDKYKTKGVTWTTSFRRKNLNASAGVAYTGRYNQFSDESEDFATFNWSPEVNGSLSYNFVNLGASLSAFYKYTGRTPYVLANTDGTYSLNQIDGFHWADITAKKAFARHFAIALGIRNLFDVIYLNNTALDTGGTHTSGPSRVAGYGRSYFATLTFNL